MIFTQTGVLLLTGIFGVIALILGYVSEHLKNRLKSGRAGYADYAGYAGSHVRTGAIADCPKLIFLPCSLPYVSRGFNERRLPCRPAFLQQSRWSLSGQQGGGSQPGGQLPLGLNPQSGHDLEVSCKRRKVCYFHKNNKKSGISFWVGLLN